jgi:hypothetical protein
MKWVALVLGAIMLAYGSVFSATSNSNNMERQYGSRHERAGFIGPMEREH